MATIKLIPSSYAVSNTSYLSVSNADNMLDECDTTDYATITNTYASTSSRYLYLRGFNFSSVPSTAIINSFTIKIRGYESGLATSNSYAPRLANGTSALSNTTASTNFGTSATTITVPTGSLTWEQIVDYGSNFTIMVYVRRASRNTTGYFYCYGAEIDVDYTIPASATVTTTLSGNGTISPSGATSTYEGAEFELTITPTNKSDTVTATQDGVDITSQLVAHGAGGSVSAVPASTTTHSIDSGSSYMQYAVGHSAESPSTSGTSSNAYAASGSTGYAEYTFDLSGIPSGATIESVTAVCYGHRENASIDSSHISKCGIYDNGTLRGSEVEFPSTSNGTITLTSDEVTSTSITVRHTVGYYGGLVLGITLTVEYSTGSGLDHYTYTYTVTGNSTIAVTIGGSVQTDKTWVKVNGTWVSASKVYEKVNGSWTEISTTRLKTIFDNNRVVKG